MTDNKKNTTNTKRGPYRSQLVSRGDVSHARVTEEVQDIVTDDTTQAADQKELELSLDFLPKGEFEMESFSDGANSNRIGYDYKREVKQVGSADKIKIKMSSAGGGFAAKISPKSSN